MLSDDAANLQIAIFCPSSCLIGYRSASVQLPHDTVPLPGSSLPGFSKPRLYPAAQPHSPEHKLTELNFNQLRIQTNICNHERKSFPSHLLCCSFRIVTARLGLPDVSFASALPPDLPLSLWQSVWKPWLYKELSNFCAAGYWQ